MADTRVPALTQISLPDLADDLYIVDVSDTTDDASGSSRYVPLSRLLGTMFPSTCEGRLTLTTGLPVTTADVTGASTLYFTPYLGSRVSLWDGTRWKMYSFSEVSIVLSSLTSAKPYDVWLYDNSGTLTLELLVWTDDTNRATALATQDGILVKSGAATRRLLGTIYTTGTTTTEDSVSNRYVSNLYNPRPRTMTRQEATASWNYSANAWQEARAQTTNRLNFVSTYSQYAVTADVQAYVVDDATRRVAAVGIGLDSTTVNSAIGWGSDSMGSTFNSPEMAHYVGMIAAGKHALSWLERGNGSGTLTWKGATTNNQQSGIWGIVWN